MYRTKHNSGFTLIELLVVIAIIAILAAILFPVFARAKAKAQQTTCLSNLKQLALGVLMYASDWNGHAPTCFISECVRWYGNVDAQEYWTGAIYPYVKSGGIYVCPSAEMRDPAYTDQPLPGRYPIPRCGYGANGVIFTHGGAGAVAAGYQSGTGGVNMDSIPDPSRIIMMSCATFDQNYGYQKFYPNWGWGGDYYSAPFTFGNWWWMNPGGPHEWTQTHQQGWNFNYCDGHANWRKCTQLNSDDYGLIPAGSVDTSLEYQAAF